MGNEDNYVYSGADIYDFQTKQNIAFEEVPEITDKNFTLTEEASCAYFVLYDSSGNSTYTTKTNPDVSDEDTDNTYYEATFVHPYVNTGLNFLKNPEHIAWGTGNAQGKFFINPYVFSPSGLNEGMGTVGTVDPVWPTPSGDEKWNSTFVQDNYIVPINSLGVHIPDHAQSIICELHIPQFPLATETIYVTTSTDWDKCIKGSDDSIFGHEKLGYDSSISLSSVPIMKSTSNNFKHIKILKFLIDMGEGSEEPGFYGVYHTSIVEIPLYRDENKMKYFNIGIISSSNWVLRAIGYRA